MGFRQSAVEGLGLMVGMPTRPVMPDLREQRLFGGLYEGRRVMVTGHTGFKGSWLVRWLRRMGAEVAALALPQEGAVSHHALLQDFPLNADLPPMREKLIDLSDAAGVQQWMQACAPEIVFHLAAQALVRPGYADPVRTYATNVMGLLHVLEAVRQTPSVKVLLNVTTDKCYRNVNSHEGYREDAPLGGHDPYSASKACAEIVTASHRDSFLARPDRLGGPVAVATARAGNVIGGGDWSADRLIPDLVRGAVSGASVAIRYPHATRPWQHVLEPLAAYLLMGQTLWRTPGGTSLAWNIGPDAEGHITVSDMIGLMQASWPAIRYEVQNVPQVHEAGLLHLDCGLAIRELGWHPVWSSNDMARHTMAWYRAWHERGEVLTDAQIDAFIAQARLGEQPWA